MRIGLASACATCQMRCACWARRAKQRPDVTILPATSELFDEGLALTRARDDKKWSLTDCTSFVAMKREGILEALTGNHFFEQAGFKPLLS